MDNNHTESILVSEKNNKKVINAWCSYDIANSAYNLIINTVLFPVYYQEVTKTAFHGDMVTFLGFSLRNSVLYDYTIAFAYMLVVFLLPLLSGVADYGGLRKRFMQFFTTLGAAACFFLYWFKGPDLGYGVALSALAVIGYAGSLQFYNSFLPQIATYDRHDKISARGFAFGYAGSMFLLIFNLITIMNYQAFGFSSAGSATKFSFLLVGIWWISVSQIAFYYLHDIPNNNKISFGILAKGFNELTNVFKQVRKNKVIKMFLLSFFFLSMGVQTVVLVASLFGSKELNMSTNKLILTIIIIQVVAMFGATLFGEVSTRKGNKLSLIIMLIIWFLACILAYFVQTEFEFYILASMVGLVMGGIQSQARSTYSKLIPSGTKDMASFFSFYDITEKVAIVLGMFTFGIIDQITGSMRNSALALSIYFLISLTIILFIKFNFNKEENASSN